MKICPNCGAQVNDSAAFCMNCGVQFTAPAADPKDHTGEFDAADIAEHKIWAMLPYLLGVIGIILVLLGAKESKYAAFHVRQSLKLLICEAITLIATGLLFWTCIVLVAGIVAECILLVLTIIAFFQVCGGKAKEPAIICNFGFLK